MASEVKNQKPTKPQHQKKYREKLKRVMNILDETLQKCGSDLHMDPKRNSQMVFEEAQNNIKEMEGDFERTERADTFHNSALLTLSNCRAGFNQSLHLAEELSKEIDDPKEAEEYIMNYMKKEQVKFFNGFVNIHDKSPIKLESGISPSHDFDDFSTMDHDESGIGDSNYDLTSPRSDTSLTQLEVRTPGRHMTPAYASRPMKKRKPASTPGTTPAHHNSTPKPCTTPHQSEQELKTPTKRRKKRLTFYGEARVSIDSGVDISVTPEKYCKTPATKRFRLSNIEHSPFCNDKEDMCDGSEKLMIFPIAESSSNKPPLAVHSLSFKENKKIHHKISKGKLKYADDSEDNFPSETENSERNENDLLGSPDKIISDSILSGFGSFKRLKDNLFEADISPVDLEIKDEKKFKSEKSNDPKADSPQSYEINNCGLFSRIQPMNFNVSPSSAKYLDNYSFPENVNRNSSNNSAQLSQNFFNETRPVPNISLGKETKGTINESCQMSNVPSFAQMNISDFKTKKNQAVCFSSKVSKNNYQKKEKRNVQYFEVDDKDSKYLKGVKEIKFFEADFDSIKENDFEDDNKSLKMYSISDKADKIVKIVSKHKKDSQLTESSISCSETSGNEPSFSSSRQSPLPASLMNCLYSPLSTLSYLSTSGSLTRVSTPKRRLNISQYSPGATLSYHSQTSTPTRKVHSFASGSCMSPKPSTSYNQSPAAEMIKSLASPCEDRMYRAAYGTPDLRKQSCKVSPRQFKFATPQQVFRSPGCIWSPVVNKKSWGPESYESPLTGTLPSISLWAPRKRVNIARRGNPPYCKRSLIRLFAEQSPNQGLSMFVTPPGSPSSPLPQMDFDD